MFRQVLHSSDTYIFLALLGVLSFIFLYGHAHTRISADVRNHSEMASALETQGDAALPLAEMVGNPVLGGGEVVLERDDHDEFGETHGISGVEDGSNTSPEGQGVVAVVFQESGDGTNEDVEGLGAESSEASLDTESADELQLPYMQNKFTEDGEWGGGYGTFSFNKEHLIVGGGDQDSSLVLLQSGELLSDYMFETLLDWHHGSSLALVARFYDYDNYVSCSYVTLGKRVSIISVENGERIVYGSSTSLPVRSYDPWKNIEFGARVYGNTLECLAGGEVALRSIIPEMSETGTVGITLWAKNPGEALATVKEVRIENYVE